MTFIFSYVAICMRLLTPRGFRRIAAENMMLRQQLIVLSRQQKGAARLKLSDRFLFGLFTSMLNQHRQLPTAA